MSTSILVNPLIRVSLTPNKVFEAHIGDELSIDANNLRVELVTQPAKYAMWSTLAELADRKAGKVKSELDRCTSSKEYWDLMKKYECAKQEHELFSEVVKAFMLRRDTLLELWGNPKSGALQKYYRSISHLRAL